MRNENRKFVSKVKAEFLKSSKKKVLKYLLDLVSAAAFDAKRKFEDQICFSSSNKKVES